MHNVYLWLLLLFCVLCVLFLLVCVMFCNMFDGTIIPFMYEIWFVCKIFSIKLRLNKRLTSYFKLPQIPFLGYNVSKDGLFMDPEKVAPITLSSGLFISLKVTLPFLALILYTFNANSLIINLCWLLPLQIWRRRIPTPRIGHPKRWKCFTPLSKPSSMAPLYQGCI